MRLHNILEVSQDKNKFYTCTLTAFTAKKYYLCGKKFYKYSTDIQYHMATFKAEVYQHQKKADGTYNIKIRVFHNGKKKYLSTVWYVTKDDLTKSFKIKNRKYIDLTDALIKRYRNMCDRLGERIKEMDADQLVSCITTAAEEVFDLDIVEYTRAYVQQLLDTGHYGTAMSYNTAVNNLVKFVGRESISIKEITVAFLNDWMRWISDHTEGNRAVSLYTTRIRAMHNRAKREFNDEDAGIIRIPTSPFSKVIIPKEGETRKRAITTEQIRALASLPYTLVRQYETNRYNIARDVFLLSFGLMGMNSVDLYNCTDCRGGRITYERTKTRTRRADRAEISVKIPPELSELITKYRDPTGKRVFRFYQKYSTPRTFNAAINKGLKFIGKDLGIDDLEFYAARHTWATIAVNEAGVDKWIVHQALDHVDDTTKVTDIYIKKSWKLIDDANRQVLDYVKLPDFDMNEPHR